MTPDPISAGLGKPRRKRREDKQLGLFAAPEPTPPPREEACAVCGRPVADRYGGRSCDRGHPDGRSRVPVHVVSKYGPSPGPIRVRALGTCGLSFVTAGDVFDAERCPERASGVWIVTPESFTESAGVSYRLCDGEWELAEPPRRRARSLDDL